MKKIISKIASFFKAGTVESMTRLMSFTVITSASISLLIFVITLCIKIGNKDIDLYGSAAIIASLATVLTVGFGGKYYGAKLENNKEEVINNN